MSLEDGQKLNPIETEITLYVATIGQVSLVSSGILSINLKVSRGRAFSIW